MDQTLKEHSLAELENLYSQGESLDQEVFAEMRSNILLVAGEHYNRKRSSFFRQIRSTKELTEQQKVRLTKNHVQKITKIYVNNILSLAPGVGFMPKNEHELQDQKAAELHEAVWQDAMEKYSIAEMVEDWADDFVSIGEICCKIFWDPGAGKIKAYQQKMDPEGYPVFMDQDQNETVQPANEMGMPHSPAPGAPIFEGGFVFDTYQGFNTLRDPGSSDIRTSSLITLRKMVDKELLEAKYPDYKGKIASSADETMVVFDATRGYYKTNNQCMVKETYFRPCPRYPQGYYFYYTKELIFDKGELPGGIFPIVTAPYERIQTTARGRGPVKHMRPYQAEINRAASKMAEHQITLGDDKLILLNGSKVSESVALPGVRAINATGNTPIILEGRDGSQYLNYMTSQIAELYKVMMVDEEIMDAADGKLDPYAMLFRAASQKRRFTRPVRRFERFLIDVCKTYLRLAKHHLPEDYVIYAIGRKEQVNMSEFKNTTELCYQIKVVPEADDLETKMGKQLTLNHLLQYTGQQLGKEEIGKLVRLMPYANLEEGFSDLTMDYDSGTNVILALDRGEMPEIHQYDNHPYMVKRLVSRMRQADFKYLAPQIQQAYQMVIQGHQEAQVQIEEAIKAAEAGFIPTDGYMVVCDLYVPDPEDPAKTKRARIPYGAVAWLIKQLEAQGRGLSDLEDMNQGAMAQMADMLLQGNGQKQGHGSPAPAAPHQSMGGSRQMPPAGPQGAAPMPAMARRPGMMPPRSG